MSDIVEELKAQLRLDLLKAEQAFREKLDRLRAHRDGARSDREYDDVTRRMGEAWREHRASIDPLRKMLDGIIMKQVEIYSMLPIVLFIPAQAAAVEVEGE